MRSGSDYNHLVGANFWRGDMSLNWFSDPSSSLATVLPAEATPIAEGRGRVLTEGLSARFAVPPFDNSAMDGFAVRASDAAAGAMVGVVGDIPAGATSTRSPKADKRSSTSERTRAISRTRSATQASPARRQPSAANCETTGGQIRFVS